MVAKIRLHSLNAKTWKAVVTAAILVASLCPGCRRESNTPPLDVETETATENRTSSVAAPDVNWVTIESAHGIVKRRSVAPLYGPLPYYRVIRFKQDPVVIMVRIVDVVAYFQRFLEEYPHLRYERALADRLQDEKDTRSEYQYDEFSRDEQRGLKYCLATLLEEGKFGVEMSGSGKAVDEVIACEYSWMWGPLDGERGRLFFLKDGTLFFGVMDWIS